MIRYLVAALVMALAQSSLALAPSDFEIVDMPLLSDKLNFKQYSGYMPIAGPSGTEMFFWFVESQDSPSTDPVLLWLNGGPGASSIGDGFWIEHGPFRLSPNASSVDLYEYSWNLHANVIYLEAPAGVGWSWSKDAAHYATNDSQASWDNYQFLLSFFEVFESFKSNDFYVTGESYGGHYVPTLAERILDNENSLNMKGFLIGNPGINSDWYYNINEYAFQTYLWSHGLLPQRAYTDSVAACGWDQFLTNCTRDFTHPTAECEAANKKAYPYIPSNWDPYDILVPTCPDGLERAETAEEVAEATAHVTRVSAPLRRLHEQANNTYNPCISRWTSIYMNRPDVVKALHADSHYERPWPQKPKGWKYGSELADIALLFPKFFSKAPHWRITIVSGDADSAVPFIGTMRWIECLGRPILNDWRNWMIDGQVAGSVIEYHGIAFATVKGCGHTIPTYCPKPGYEFLANFLENSWA